MVGIAHPTFIKIVKFDRDGGRSVVLPPHGGIAHPTQNHLATRRFYQC